MVWQLLLGYLPSNMSRRKTTLKRRRNEYASYITQYWRSMRVSALATSKAAAADSGETFHGRTQICPSFSRPSSGAPRADALPLRAEASRLVLRPGHERPCHSFFHRLSRRIREQSSVVRHCQDQQGRHRCGGGRLLLVSDKVIGWDTGSLHAMQFGVQRMVPSRKTGATGRRSAL